MTTEFTLDEQLLEKINRFSRKKLTEEEIYCFPVILCDNEIDRDGERFSVAALNKLAKLFIGKTGIFDHDPKGSNQSARIFDTCVMEDPSRTTGAGEPYTALTAKAYMVRTSGNADLIAEIDGGIKKEVSVSCGIRSRKCSVCGSTKCRHVKGQSYGGVMCHTILDDPTDAYEWSFVAIPAQPNAGVSKAAAISSGKAEKAELPAAEETVRRELITQVMKKSWIREPRLVLDRYREYLETLGTDRLAELKKSLDDVCAASAADDAPCITGEYTAKFSADNKKYKI